MKKFMLAALAAAVLAGCKYYVPSTGENVALQDQRYVPTGSNIPRKAGQGSNPVGTMSKVELESMRMNPGTPAPLPGSQ